MHCRAAFLGTGVFPLPDLGKEYKLTKNPRESHFPISRFHFTLSVMRRTILPFLTTLFFAAALWVAVNLAGEVQTTVRIPVTVELPEGRAASTSLPRWLHATVRGPGWKIVQFALLGKPACRVDLTETPIGESVALTRRALLQSIGHPPELTLSDIEPDSIHVELEALRERTVPVVPAVHLLCRRGFEQTERPHVEPDSIRIAGAESVVSRISAWSTMPVWLTGVAHSVRLDVALSDSLSDLISVPQQSVTVAADVQEISERTFTQIPIHLINAPADAHIRLDPPTATVLVRGGAETLAAMQSTDLRATIDYLALVEELPDRAPVDVTGPPHTTVMRQDPRSVSWFVRTTP